MTEEVVIAGLGNFPREAADLADYLSNTSAALPPVLEPEEAAKQTLAFYEESGREGATFSLRFGDMRGQLLFAVSVYPDRSLKLPGGVLEIDTLLLFIQVNINLLSDPRCSLGLWSSEAVTYCDVVALLPNKQEAMALAAQYDQIAIFDLYTLTEIGTGGTGNTPSDVPPDAERLPEINSEEEPL